MAISPDPSIPNISEAPSHCYHCGNDCGSTHIWQDSHRFCCDSCKSIYLLLSQHQMGNYYSIESFPGTKQEKRSETDYGYLDHPQIRDQILDFQDEYSAQLTLRLPDIHCSSCIWLLEHLHQLHPGVKSVRVQFLRKEARILFSPEALPLRELVELLDRIGYPPEIQLSQTQKPASKKRSPLILQLAVAGFCFGNIMLLSFPEYLGLSLEEESFRSFFGFLNIILAIPVLAYSARPFFESAFRGLREQFLNIDLPISLGILTLFSRSVFEITTGIGSGYMDSLAALVFFLLIGRWVQQRTFETLSFERDYAAYFPISALRIGESGEQHVPITDLQSGDRILLRNEALIPADATLLSESASFDYSFVTGESRLVERQVGDKLYAGGRLMGQAVEIQLSSSVSQSYLTSLWNHDAFQSTSKQAKLQSWVDQISRKFTITILSIAGISGLIWWLLDGWGMAAQVATSVLIVACPCALALATPVIMGWAQHYLGKRGLFTKNLNAVEQMAQLDHLVFDKTGTLTHRQDAGSLTLMGELDSVQSEWVASLARNSQHPISMAIYQQLHQSGSLRPVEDFEEMTGTGIQGTVDGHAIKIAKRASTSEAGIAAATTGIWIDDELVAEAQWESNHRPGVDNMLQTLSETYELSLISGDQNQSETKWKSLFPQQSDLAFNQSPSSKLAYIQSLQASGKKVLMMGDGLNDAGALQASDVGIALSEHLSGFSPACDAILSADQIGHFPNMLKLSQWAFRGVKVGFLISLAYNLIGLTIAVQGLLSPVIAAILMPVSSLSVVLFGWGYMRLATLKTDNQRTSLS
ncbi:heavy metal translocating P-type ATPase metal-binding domain-containing protein [Pontibacter sp. G13]|uniref:heavy metal translocating P-type ATPase n=1 Tax=Pontibacter sp. G13 TaxID=3074898 RepID=UPI00288A2BB0|nr:heavy metal translocating P-type ATPase metal-binding domain-containing protein [Pontibacter sp. G13]WNJ16086.1 heavy metal translocating P-type ATPase metal-binding domain-containing protein [Pontibacter sp. G13]